MSRGLKGMYLNTIKSSDVLDPAFQLRVFHLAQRTKDQDLAAALACRRDTLAVIDEQLGKWSTAKVLSAWFARPDRDLTAAVASLRKEKRITVLEVIAGLADLPTVVYEICAKRDAPRVALALAANNSAPLDFRCIAARTISRNYSTLSYNRRSAITTIVSAEQAIGDAFIQASTDPEVCSVALAGMTAIDDASVDVLYQNALHWVRTTARQYEERVTIDKHNNNRRSYGIYEVSNALQHLGTMVSHIVALTDYDSPNRELVHTALVELDEAFAQKRMSYDDDLHRKATEILNNLTASSTPQKRTPSLTTVRDAASAESLERIVETLTNQRVLDRSAAIGVLCHEHATPKSVHLAIRSFGWGELTKVLEARGRDIALPVKAQILVETHDVSDTRIAKVAAPASPAELWMEVVYHLAAQGFIPTSLLSSTHARPDVIPKMSLKVFAQEDLPGWVMTGFASLLASELTTTESWDAFEVLAPNHLGTVAQVLRAAKLTTKRITNQATTDATTGTLDES